MSKIIAATLTLFALVSMGIVPAQARRVAHPRAHHHLIKKPHAHHHRVLLRWH